MIGLSILRWFRRPSSFERRIGYQFRDTSHLNTALGYHRGKSRLDVGRLAFLGDAVLGVVISRDLFHQDPKMNGGELTQARSKRVCKDALVGVANRWRLLSEIQSQTGLKMTNVSSHTLADMVESVVGAVYCDGGLGAAEIFIRREMGIAMSHPLESPQLDGAGELTGNAKSQLQITCQQRWQLLPDYRLLETTGPDHDPEFRVRVTIQDHLEAEGTGKTIKSAEAQAATVALEQLNTKEDGK